MVTPSPHLLHLFAMYPGLLVYQCLQIPEDTMLSHTYIHFIGCFFPLEMSPPSFYLEIRDFFLFPFYSAQTSFLLEAFLSPHHSPE